ncbi:hypothetical protein DJ82_12875 [Halorubrum sp. Ib24]|uniref:COG1470 family protein n=1 Tax=Halorubrum sp. Ib24 TaxID=1383850 RepID=UPI000B98CE6B|nr:hypothetical protein [Halorubrum sp. Ib24]OYR38160.1 hypothetical protein DJ82_12875 [Halorubrum sp. Ib24]
MSAASATLNTKAVAVLVAVAVIGVAGVGGAIAGVGPTGGFDVPFVQEADPAPAPETQVQLRASDSTVRVGETATYDVVVANASGGVGDHAAVVSVGDPSVASIADVSLRGNQSDEAAGVSIAADGSSANLTAGPTDIAENGGVVVATVTVSGDATGTSDVELSVDGLATEAGDPYNVTAVRGASLTVEPNSDPAAFRVSRLNASHNVTEGEPFNVSVSVTNDGDLEATQTVRYGLDLDGNGTLDRNETVAAREVTLASHDRETVTFSGVNATDVDPGSHRHGVSTENDSVTGVIGVEAAESTPAPETAVRLLPSGVPADADDPDDASETVDAGETTTYEVVVANASGGVGAQDFRVAVEDPTHATITGASVSGGASDATTEITFVDDGHSVNVTAALTDTADNGTVTVATLTISGHAVGTTDIELRVDALGTENGTAYNVTAVTGASVTVESDYDGGSTSAGDSDESSDGASFTPDEISRAKYGVAFTDLGSETSGEVQAIYNRQPFAGDAGPGEIDTRNEISEARYNVSLTELDRDAVIEVQNAYDAQFGALPSDPAYTRDEISQAKYDTAFADLNAEQTGEVQAIYNRQPFPGDTAPGDIRTRDEITNDRYGQDFIDLSRQTTIDIQNDYDAQFGDAEE